MSLELNITAFDTELAANEAIRVVDVLQQGGVISLYDAAVVSKSQEGKIKIKDLQDLTSPQGALVGAISGGLVGLLGGPVGAVVGVMAGAATGGVTAAVVDLGFPKKELEGMGELLPLDSSALILLYDNEMDLFEGATNGRFASNSQIHPTATLTQEISTMFTEAKVKVKNQWEELVANGKQTLGGFNTRIQAQIVKTHTELNDLKAKATTTVAEARARNEAELDALSSRLADQREALEHVYFAHLANLKTEISMLKFKVANATGEAKTSLEAKLAEAQADYKAGQEQFKTNAETNLRELNAQIEALNIKAAALKGEARVKANLLTLEVKTKKEQAEARLNELKMASVAAWDDIERGWSTARRELRQAYQQAAQEFKKY